MAKAVQKITLSRSRDIPFNKLVLSQSNVRRVKAGISIEQLAESIAQRTLLQSLNVRAILDADGNETGVFEVPAGGRYRALELLVQQKRMAKTQPVPCVVREGGIAEDDSIAENDERVGLHPLDQFRAFQTLRTLGMSEEDIAARHFVTPAIVKQRLRLLSDAQLESMIYAGEAHAGYLAGSWSVDATFDVVSAAPDYAENAVRFRGWFLGDGTGAGKGRQVAGILLDNWLKGRRRAVWVSKSDKLIDDAQRDWSALGQERLLITPLARFRQGTPIRLDQGILFTTYATLRSDAREEKVSRVRQIVDWLGRDFDGVIVFDESHAMQNAAGEKSERGEQAPSQQGRAGLADKAAA